MNKNFITFLLLFDFFFFLYLLQGEGVRRLPIDCYENVQLLWCIIFLIRKLKKTLPLKIVFNSNVSDSYFVIKKKKKGRAKREFGDSRFSATWKSVATWFGVFFLSLKTFY
jgi:hypothetical protein